MLLGNNTSTSKNYLYQLILTLTNSLYPLIISPYISRVLGASVIGKINYAASVVTWLTTLAAFGINNYGLREVAKNKDNRRNLSIVVIELIILNMVFVIIALIIYAVVIGSIPAMKMEILLFLISGISLILNPLIIDWFYQGVEQFRYICIRNLIVKIATIFLIYFIIKKKSDYIKYSTILALGVIVNNIYNYIYSREFIDYKYFDSIKPFKHIKSLSKYAINNFIISFNQSLNKAILGSINQNVLVAIYTRSIYICNVGLSILYSLSKVVVSKSTRSFINGDIQEYKRVVRKVYNFTIILALPIFFGINLLSFEIMYVLGGNEFAKYNKILEICSILIITNSIYHWLYNQNFIPNGKENIVIIVQLISSTVLILINLFYFKIGPIIFIYSDIIAQSLVTIILLIYSIKNNYLFNLLNISVFKSLISCLPMIIFIKIFKLNYICNDLLSLFVCIFVTSTIYLIMLLLLKEKMVFELILKIKNVIKKYRKVQ